MLALARNKGLPSQQTIIQSGNEYLYEGEALR